MCYLEGVVAVAESSRVEVLLLSVNRSVGFIRAMKGTS